MAPNGLMSDTSAPPICESCAVLPPACSNALKNCPTMFLTELNALEMKSMTCWTLGMSRWNASAAFIAMPPRAGAILAASP